jgi:hypothetical protein
MRPPASGEEHATARVALTLARDKDRACGWRAGTARATRSQVVQSDSELGCAVAIAWRREASIPGAADLAPPFDSAGAPAATPAARPPETRVRFWLPDLQCPGDGSPCGRPSVPGGLGRGKRLARYPQLYSRIGFVHHWRHSAATSGRSCSPHDWDEPALALSADDFDAEEVGPVACVTGGTFASPSSSRRSRGCWRSLGSAHLEIKGMRTVTRDVVKIARDTRISGQTSCANTRPQNRAGPCYGRMTVVGPGPSQRAPGSWRSGVAAAFRFRAGRFGAAWRPRAATGFLQRAWRARVGARRELPRAGRRWPKGAFGDLR